MTCLGIQNGQKSVRWLEVIADSGERGTWLWHLHQLSDEARSIGQAIGDGIRKVIRSLFGAFWGARESGGLGGAVLNVGSSRSHAHTRSIHRKSEDTQHGGWWWWEGGGEKGEMAEVFLA